MARKYEPRTNVEVANLIRLHASPDYQRRIPDVDKANVQQTLKDMWEYRPHRNEFAELLVNRIAREYVVFQQWNNKLGVFKKDQMVYGDTIEEIGVGLTKSERYDPNRNYLEGQIFGQRKPDIRTAFHRVNRQDVYPITIQEPMLRRAFLSDTGLSNFVAALMQSPLTSSEWDEYLLMAGLFREMYDLGAFFKQNVPDLTLATSDSADARHFLKLLRGWADKVGFIEPHYNLARLDTFIPVEKRVLFVTPEVKAALDVDGLAQLFNLDYGNLEYRVITVRQEDVRIEGFQALLTTEDFFMVVNTLLENTSANNPVGLFQNFFHHIQQIISASPMAPGILFTSTEASDVIEITPTPVQSVTVEVQDVDGNVVTQVERGQVYNIVGTAVTNPEGGYNDATRLEIDPTTSDSTFTYLVQEGMFIVGLNEGSDSITINAYATDTPYPDQISASVSVAVVGDKVTWPPLDVEVDSDNDGLIEVTPKAPTQSGNDVTIPTVKGVIYKNGATTVSGKITITADTTITATADTGYEIATGATTSWTFTFTP